MPISNDLKSVHVALAAVAHSVAADKEPVIRLVCANILSLAEQVEALENMPMGMPHVGHASFIARSVSEPLQ